MELEKKTFIEWLRHVTPKKVPFSSMSDCSFKRWVEAGMPEIRFENPLIRIR